VLRSIEIDAANFIERIARLRRPGFPWQALHYRDHGPFLPCASALLASKPRCPASSSLDNTATVSKSTYPNIGAESGQSHLKGSRQLSD
jgi:hypothetical protein